MRKSVLLLFCTFTALQSQVSIDEKPYSFKYEKIKTLSDESRLEYTPTKSIAAALREDEEEKELGLPPRFGLKTNTSLNLWNSGTWMNLPDGGRLWRLQITSAAAKSINLIYDAFHLPSAGRFHIYNVEKTHVIGAFTELNNKGTLENPGQFATGLVYGDKVILEYYHPPKAEFEAIISISGVIHGYKYIRLLNNSIAGAGVEESGGFGDSGDCQVNINCPEGNNWQNEKKGIALLVLGNGTRLCSGSLVNNTRQNGKPYLLTAHHCLAPDNLDAQGNTNASTWMFYWNYEAPNCSDPVSEPSIKSTTGATLRANRFGTDFALFELIEDPVEDACYDVYHNGWDRTTSPGQGGVGIHHPSSDVKKISTYNMVPIDGQVFGTNFWRVNWIATTNGHSVTESGSSGSPLFRAGNKRIIGQLRGGSAIDCIDPANDPGEYGKLHLSWDGTSSTRRLKDWLAPNSSATTLAGRKFLYDNTLGLSVSGPATDGWINATVSGGVAPYTWTLNGSITWTTNVPYTTRYVGCNGAYLFVSSQVPCGLATGSQYIYPCTGGGYYRTTVYPNPTRGFVNVSETEQYKKSENYIPLLNDAINLTLLDSSGNPTKTEQFDGKNEQVKLDVSGLREGNYFLIIKGEKIEETHQILIK